MWRVLKLLIYLLVLGAVGLVAYAYVGPIFFADDFAAPVREITRPVTLELE